TNYVNAGGRLLAMRPDSQIKGLFGLGGSAGLLNSGYLRIDTNVALNDAIPGQDLTNATLQIHGDADRYSPVAGAVALAQLYSNATTSTIYPAVISAASGRAVAFTYDLAQNVVYTRQGNPANANVDTDGDGVLRTVDLFLATGGGSPWVNRDKIPIPQADEQQRLFARLVKQLVGEVRPLPQLWYFPGNAKTMLIPTGDAHANPTSYYQNEITSLSGHGGTATFYISQGGEPSSSQMNSWRSQGYEFGIHPSRPLTSGYLMINGWWDMTHPTVPKSRTVRNHQVAWEGWTAAADIEVTYGMALDTNFYHWGTWLQKGDGSWPHGYITGSGQPMKFIRADGTVLPLYQQLTQLVDEHLISGISGGFENLSATQAISVSKELIDASQAGDYAALMTQFHVDYYGFGALKEWAEGTLDYANNQGVPIWNADQWLSFTEIRHDAEYGNITWNNTTKLLNFDLSATATSGINLTAILPLTYQGN
ncbi:MAG TPA: hypothetical protein VEC93_04905, partial [Anaerolineae bacterium]|nr:hypothetical protein [Anaerolineae bacterium]